MKTETHPGNGINPLKRILYSPINAQMVVTRRCNLSCAYCNEFDKTSPPVPLDQLKRQMKKLGELGTFTLTMTGGEPLLHPNISDLVRLAKGYVSEVSIITNGFLLTSDTILKLNSSSLDRLQISIDGVNPNGTTVKVLKCLQDKLILLKKYARFAININAVIGSIDSEETLEVIEFSNKLDFTSTVGLLHDENGQIGLSERERKKYALINRRRRRPFWDIYAFEKDLLERGECPFKCRAGGRYLYIDEFGNVHWCSQTRGIFQKPLMDYTFKDLKDQFYKQKECSTKCTVGCVRRVSFLDNWRRQEPDITYGPAGSTHTHPHPRRHAPAR